MQVNQHKDVVVEATNTVSYLLLHIRASLRTYTGVFLNPRTSPRYQRKKKKKRTLGLNTPHDTTHKQGYSSVILERIVEQRTMTWTHRVLRACDRCIRRRIRCDGKGTDKRTSSNRPNPSVTIHHGSYYRHRHIRSLVRLEFFIFT